MKDVFAVILAAFVVIGPLSVGPIQHLTHGVLFKDDGTNQLPTWLTLLVISPLQLIVLFIQASIMRRQGDIARNQFVAAYRPRLRVRNIIIHPSHNFNRVLFQGDYISGQCYVSNVGGSKARIIESYIMLYTGKLGMRRAYEGEDANNPITGDIQAGSSKPLIISAQTPFATGDEAARALRGETPLFVMGWISYADDVNIERRTAFCRRWNPVMERFEVLTEDRDYEHEE